MSSKWISIHLIKWSLYSIKTTTNRSSTQRPTIASLKFSCHPRSSKLMTATNPKNSRFLRKTETIFEAMVASWAHNLPKTISCNWTWKLTTSHFKTSRITFLMLMLPSSSQNKLRSHSLYSKLPGSQKFKNDKKTTLWCLLSRH